MTTNKESNRRISKRKIKRPSYFEQFHTDESKDVKMSDADAKMGVDRADSTHELPAHKIKLSKVAREVGEAGEETKAPTRKYSRVRNLSQGKTGIGFRVSLAHDHLLSLFIQAFQLGHF
jgi:hypothetical protein